MEQCDLSEALNRWGEALATRDPMRISLLYAPQAILLGTFSRTNRDTPELIRNYFEGFSQLDDLSVKFLDVKTRDYQELATASGIYQFSWSEPERRVTTQARFTFVFQKYKGEWRIVEHHSSVLPDNL